MSHWSCSLLLVLLHYWPFTLTRTLGYLVVALCCGEPAALDMKNWPPYMLQQFIDGMDVGSGGSLIALVLDLGGS